MSKGLEKYFVNQYSKSLPRRDAVDGYLYNLSARRNEIVRKGGQGELTSVRASVGHYVCSMFDENSHNLS